MGWYRTGTATVTNNSATVTGVGTDWVEGAALGETFLGPDGQCYEITQILGATSMRISPNYKGSTAAAQAYAIMPTRGDLEELTAEAAKLIASYAAIRDGAGKGKFAAGTVAAPSLRGAADEDTGVNLPGGNVLDLIAGGAVKAKVNSAGLEVHGRAKATTAELGAITSTGDNTFSGKQAISNTTPSTSTTTGAITIAGGLGVGGSIHTGSTLSWLSPDSQAAPMAFIRDAYRQQVEAASGGRQTVLYTAKGQPSIMNVIPAFNLEDIDASLGTGVHPAFIAGGVQKSEIFIGTHIGSVYGDELISRPGEEPARSRNHDQFVTLARACGAGWHVMTNAEWSAIALWSYKNGTMPNGNTNYGRSSDAPHETARRMDLLEPGNTGGNPRTRTGSGPATWRHDHTMHGISDLCGNVWEWSPGLRLMDGEIQIIPNNDAALDTDLSKTSTAWRAIRASDGALVAPGTAGALKFDSTVGGAVTSGQPILSDEVTNRNGEAGDDSNATGSAARAFQTLVAKEGITAPAITKALGLFPISDSLGGDRLYLRNYGERLPVRGGNWGSGAGAGVFALDLGYPRSGAGTGIGARPAFVI